jgi:hypothetical protein
MFGDLSSNTPSQNPKEKTELEDLKKKRDEYTVEIRRQKREELLNKRRNFNFEIDKKYPEGNWQGYSNISSTENAALKAHIDECLKKTYTMNDFFELIEAINSDDRMKQHYGVIGLRKILSIEDGPPIQPVIDANLVPRLINFMQRDDEPHLQLEAAWALTNVASGTTQQTQSIIDKGGIPHFIRLLRSKRPEVAEQAIWAIGNIAGDSPQFRNMILKLGGLEPLLIIIDTAKNKNTIKHGTWALSNLCRGRPLPDFEAVKRSIPTLSKVIQEEVDAEVLTDAAWAMSYLSDGDEHRINMVIQTGIVPALVKHLDNPFLSILIPILRTLGNIVTGNETQTNLVLGVSNVITKLFKLLNHEKKAVRRETCWTLSNITAGTAEQIEYVISNPSHISHLIAIATSDTTEVKREAAWVLSNATNHGVPDQLLKMLQCGLLDCFTTLLDSEDSKTVIVVLEGLNNILNCGAQIAIQHRSENPFLIELEEKGAVPKIEKLQEHPSHEVYQKSLKILENHFELEDVL